MSNHNDSDSCPFRIQSSNPGAKKPAVSLIISFYNNIDLLKMIFKALENQTFHDFEVVLADDGSKETIIVEVSGLMETVSFPVTHCWHEDNGWQKNIILNEAIRQSKGSYLIFMDGDCIPHSRFIEEHYNSRNEGKVITGRRVQLTEYHTRKLSVKRISSGKLERGLWLELLVMSVFTKVKHVENAIRIKNKHLRKLLIKDKENGILGCNFSIFKSDILKVNGFDERFRHPGTGEDTDLNSRLLRAGIKTLSKKHLLTIYHIYHKKFNLNYQPNIDLWEENNLNGITFTPFGIHKTDSMLKSSNPDNG